ncbi:M16 family metallopeptidase [Candidatus Pelagibacter sp.]|uniref:M16 family metallopeptidase n=1 Tax=Candidatus Pelagibacter sp. TaxID=2024849 RepID=UPI003F843646
MKKILLIFFLFVTHLKAESVFPLDPAITYGKLENGLTYYIRENKEPKGKAYVKMIINAGSAMEEDHQRGLAHLLEHMAFNGSKNFPKYSIDEFMSSIGLNIGTHYNATTGFFTTDYEYEIPTNDPKNLKTTIQIFADVLKNLSLEPEAFERERKIVEEEWRGDLGADQRYIEDLYSVIHKNSLLEKRKPIGDIEIIRNFEYQDVIDFYEKWYQPEITAIYVVGEINTSKTVELIKENFSSFKNTRKTIFPDYSIPDFENNRFISNQDKEFDNIVFSIWEKQKFNKLNTIENYRTDLINRITVNIFNRRVSETIAKGKLNFVYGGIYSAAQSDLDEYKISVATLNEKYINEGILEFSTLIAQAEKYGFLKAELDLEKKKSITDLQKNITEKETRSSYSYVDEYKRHFINDEMISGPEKELEYAKEIYSSIDINDINNHFKTYILGKNQIISIKGPDYLNLPNETQIKDLIQKAKQNQIEPYKFEIKETTLIKKDLKNANILKKKRYPKSGVIELSLSNGPKVFLKQTDFKKDQILLSGYSAGGLSRAKDEILSSAENLQDILFKVDIGDLTVSEKENLYPIDIVDAYLTVDEYEEGVEAYSNNYFLEDMFKLMYVNFTDLRIKDIHVNQFKKNLLNQYNIDKKSPKNNFEIKFKETLFQKHPRKKFETDKEINSININDVKNFYKDRFQDGGNFNFYIVGDFKYDQIEPLILKYIGNLPKIDREDGPIDHDIRFTREKHELVYEENDPKKASVFRFYFKEFDNTVKERFKFNLLFSVADKLLRDEIREKENLVYSINMGKYFDKFYPSEIISFYTAFGSDPPNVDKISEKINETFQKIKDKDFDEKVFKEQKISLMNEFEENLRSNTFWKAIMEISDQNNQYIERSMNIDLIINSITLRDISQIAKKFLDDNYLKQIELIKE